MPAALSPVRRLFDRAFNHGDLTTVDELVSPDLITHLPGWGLPAGRLGLKQMIANLRAAFPDLLCTIEDEIREGDRLAAHWTMRGSHQGPYFGSRPTGRAVAVQGFIFARMANGRVVENWILVDQVSLLQQLGMIPPPKGKGVNRS